MRSRRARKRGCMLTFVTDPRSSKGGITRAIFGREYGLTSVPVCRDARSAETCMGYFDFSQLTICALLVSCRNLIGAICCTYF